MLPEDQVELPRFRGRLSIGVECPGYGGHQTDFLALRNITVKWKTPTKEWNAAKAQFALQFGDRFVLAA